MPTLTTTLLLLTVLLVLLPSEALAFGAGDIPDFAFLNDKAFRHGDIESVLTTLVKTAGAASGGGGILGFAQNLMNAAQGGAKFSSGDVKKVYFGNWLRDYSQAMDIAGLSKLSADTLVIVVAVLGFMSFGFATGEFEVTADRLGVYLPIEHIDNPKGYAEKEGDARQFHPKLRPPVDPRELEIDERNGMKKYMATDNEGWDTSTAHIRRTFQWCIRHGRKARGHQSDLLWEAYRLLGTGLHTMEDLLAHSNWCELVLRKMGHEQVFCHVGDNVIIDTPNGPAPPLVTGTFGSADFYHSMLGEATDHLSQTSMIDLSAKMQESQGQDQNQKFASLKSLFGKFGGGEEDKMNQGQDMQEQSKAYSFNPDDIAPPEVQQQLWEILKWRDSLFKDILQTIERIPGLSDLVDSLTEALNAYVYTLITPYLAPIVTQVTSVLGEGSKAVIDSDDQYETFDNPDASDPSHSLLSKDHFGLILNEPAGRVAIVVVENTVKHIVEAWSNDVDENQVIDEILEAFHHPYFNTGNSRIQHDMFLAFDKWFGGLGSEDSERVLEGLTKEGVRNGRNKRLSQEEEEEAAGANADHYNTGRQSSFHQGGQTGGYGHQTQSEGYGQQTQSSYGRAETSEQEVHQPSYEQPQRNEYGGGGYGQESESRGYQPSYVQSGGGEYGSSERRGYGGEQSSYNSGGGGRDERSYGQQENRREQYGGGGGYGGEERSSGRREERSGYGGESESYGGREEVSGYEGRQGSGYGGGGEGGYGRREEVGYGQREESGYGRREEGGFPQESGYGRREEVGYAQREESGYGRREEGGRPQESVYAQESAYGRREEVEGYGQREEGGYGGGYGGAEERREEHHGQHHGRHHGRHHEGSEYQGEGGGEGAYGRQDETFGVERMNIRGEEERESGGYGEREY